MLHVLTNTRSTDEHARLSHLCQLARWCARYTTWGFSWEGACTVRSHRHFVAVCARILILHTGHVRHRGVQQHRQEVVDCAGACEFVARLQGELDGGEHDAPSRDLRENLIVNNVASLHVAAPCPRVTAASGREWKLGLRSEVRPLDRTETATWRATLLRHADCDVKAAGGSLITELQRERRHAVIRGAVRRKRSWDALGTR